ncbi:hypothetical protein, partial [Streptomyces marokkonensis]|uniref:hypothetical protein n=1 Tax=Streptomyces marokkonensis TaxID=324855 RepID=UPI0031F0C7E4
MLVVAFGGTSLPHHRITKVGEGQLPGKPLTGAEPVRWAGAVAGVVMAACDDSPDRRPAEPLEESCPFLSLV